MISFMFGKFYNQINTKMKRLLTRVLIVASFAAITTNVTNAAFKVAKEGTAIVSSVSSKTTEATITTKVAKKEIKSAVKAEKANGGGLRKSKIAAALLAFFLGGFGVHSFYMGQTGKGFAQLGGSVLGLILMISGLAGYVSGAGTSFPTLALIGYLLFFGVGIWAFVDFIRILTGGLEPESGFDS